MKRQEFFASHCLFLLIAIFGAFSVCIAAVRLPDYSDDQLRDKSFVQDELQRFTELGKKLSERMPQATDLVKLSIRTDLQRLNIVTSALQFVAANGYDPRSADMQKLAFFQRKTFPSMPVVIPAPELVEEKIYEISDKGLAPPIPVTTPAVEVPVQLIGSGINGAVKARFVIDSRGIPKKVEIIEGISKVIDAIVEKTILEKWRYSPAVMDRQPVPVYFRVIIPFNLETPAESQPATPPAVAAPADGRG